MSEQNMQNMQEVNQVSKNVYKTGRSMNAQHLYLTFMRTIQSEFVKLRGLASTWWCMTLTIVLPAVFGLLVAFVQKSIDKAITSKSAGQSKTSAVVMIGSSDKSSLINSQEGIFHLAIGFASISLIVIAIFAVLAITAEHSTSSIQASLTTVPRRGMFFAAKFIAVAIYVFITQLVAMAATLAAVELAFIGDANIAGLTGSKAWQLPLMLFLGSPVIMVVAAAMAYGFGMICKSTAGGIMCVIGVSMILPTVVSIIAIASNFAQWSSVIQQLLPATAVSQFLGDASHSAAEIKNASMMFTWWQSGLVVLGWAVVMYAIGYILEKRRDM